MKTRATLIGFTAILMWSFLALMTAASGTMPPFQLSAITFAIGSLPGLILFAARPERLNALRQPPKVWLAGVGGLFGYHFLYFTALRNAPAVEAGLIAYLWPLLIVLFSGLLPGERLKAIHVTGAVIGFSGVAVLSGGAGLADIATYWPGYLCAIGSALFWSGYSVLSRRFAAVPTDAVTGFCLGAAALGVVTHLAF